MPASIPYIAFLLGSFPTYESELFFCLTIIRKQIGHKTAISQM